MGDMKNRLTDDALLAAAARLYLLDEEARAERMTRRAPWVARACWTGAAAVAVVLLGMGVWYGR